MNKIEAYYDGISHGKDTAKLADDIIRKANHTAKKRSFRPAAVAVAAAVLMVGGVTAAAATGLLNINDMFGGRISAQDEQLAQGLVGAAKDFTWTTSDDDYAIELKGVTGSESDMLLMYEIVRADGRPVTDFMTNIPEDGELDMFTDISFSDHSPYMMTGSDMYFINEDGNVDIYYRIITNGNITGEHYSQKSVNLYPEKMLWDYLQHKDVGIVMHMPREWSDRPIGFYNDEAFNDKTPLDIPINDENIIGLELEWSIDFTYYPSDIAALSKSIPEEDADVEVTHWKSLVGGLETLDCNVTYSHFSCVGGWLEVEYAGEAYIGSNYEGHNEVYLLMDNDEIHPCSFVGRGHTFYGDEAVTGIDIEVRYGDAAEDTISAVDIEKIKAVYINGKTFPLA